MYEPKYRYGLKSKIIGCGYGTLTEFSNQNGIPLPMISKIIKGWEIPTVPFQKRLANALGMTLTELRELL